MSMGKMRVLISVMCACCVAFSSCTFVDTVVDKASQVAGETVGKKIGKRAGEATLRGLSPAMRQAYVSSVFSVFFYGGGYQFNYHDYKPGEWTKWQVTGMEQGDEFEKAFLKRDAKGLEWWRISTRNVTEGETEEVILEALFSARDKAGERNLLRLRGLFPGDKEPGEIPVQEDTSAWYSDPVRLTRESLEAATKGIDTITTPAGRFRARHLVYKTVHGVSEWWLSDKVPGGMVKYQITASESEEGGEKDMYSVQLAAFGSGAKSRLQSF